MSDGEPPKSRPIRAVKQTSGLLPADRVKPVLSPELQSEADKRREEREIAKEQREEAKEKREERAARLSRRVATFAVVVSLLGSGATATVAIMSMKATQASAQANIRASAEQAQNAFLRDQKKSAYANFYSAAMDVEAVEGEISKLFAEGLPRSVPETGRFNYFDRRYESLQQKLEEKYDNLDTALSIIYMSGSGSVIGAAEQLKDSLHSGDVWLAREEAFAANAYGYPDRMKKVSLYLASSADNDLPEKYLDAVRQDYGQESIH